MNNRLPPWFGQFEKRIDEKFGNQEGKLRSIIREEIQNHAIFCSVKKDWEGDQDHQGYRDKIDDHIEYHKRKAISERKRWAAIMTIMGMIATALGAFGADLKKIFHLP